jgi:hypothetical protein
MALAVAPPVARGDGGAEPGLGGAPVMADGAGRDGGAGDRPSAIAPSLPPADGPTPAPTAPPAPPAAPPPSAGPPTTSAAPGSLPLVSPATPAPTALLRGTVWEKGTRRRLAGASVSVDAVPIVETDESGGFSARVAPGRHRVEVQLPGFEILEQAVEVDAAGSERNLRLLRRSADRRYQSVVSAPAQAPKVSLSGEEARTTPGAAGDPFRVIESLPGVAQLQWPLALYAIRGANPGNTGFFVDGMRVPALFHFALGPSVIHPYLIERLDFYPGGYPARFGGYVSGVIAAETMPPPADLPHASIDIRTYDAGGIVTSPWDGGRGTIAVAGRYSFTGALASLLFPSVKFSYSDYQVRADHPLAGGRATVTAIGSFDSLNLKFHDFGDGALEFHRLDLRWDHALGPGRLRLRATLGTDWARSNLFQSPISVRAYSVVPRIDYAARLASFAELELGAEAKGERFLPTIPPMPGSPSFDDLARSRAAATLAAYAALALRLGGWLELTPGMRLVQYREQGAVRLGPEPRLGGRLALGPRVALKGAAGQFTQMASLPVGVPGFESFNLRDYGLQRSRQASLGGEVQVGDAWQIDLTGFYQLLLVSDIRSTFSTDLRQQNFLEMRDGRGYGLELLIRRRDTHRLHGWLAYTLSKSERDFGGVTGPSDWDQRHILNLVGSYRLGGGYSVGGRFHLHTGRPYPVETSGNTLEIEYRRLPTFYQLDLRADRRIVYDRFILTVYVELGNATLTKEVSALSTTFDENGNRTTDGQVRELGYRIILPSIGVHAEF